MFEVQKGKKGWAVWEVQANGFDTRVSDWCNSKAEAQAWVDAQTPAAEEAPAAESAEGPAVERTEDVTVVHVPTVECGQVPCGVCERLVAYNPAGPVPDTCHGCLDTAYFDYEPAGDGFVSSRKLVQTSGPRVDESLATAMRLASLE